MRSRLLLIRWVTLVAAGFGIQTPSNGAPQFERDILPVFYHHCMGCHSEKQSKPKAGLRLDDAEAIGKSNVIHPGKPQESELMRRVDLPHSDKEAMPPLKGGAQPLNEHERELIRQWIAAGADFKGWSQFDHRDPPRLPVAAVAGRSDVLKLATQLQETIERQQIQKGINPNGPIGDDVFLRRVYLDVMGRIPSPAETVRFLRDPAPERRSKLIDLLLDSEGYVSHTFNWKADQLRILSGGIAGQPGWLYDDWLKQSIRSGSGHDVYVRGLITASGYLWENGAVGFYLRDLGMPLDHLSNLTRVFLGTRIECAQCHDHPLEPITQRDFYQMAAYTFPVSNLHSSSGYSLEHVAQWPEIQRRLDAMHADGAFRQGVSRTISFLKRKTTDTDHELTFPAPLIRGSSQPREAVSPRTLFGDEAPASSGNQRAVFADWMVSPRNPRFARNIANRLWRRVMGLGLIEPVDALSALTRAEYEAVMEFLTDAIVQLRYDERAFLAMLLNTRLYQSEAVREEPPPGSSFGLRGPNLRRLSAEQIWDSLLVFLVEDVDERKSLIRREHSELNPERLKQLTSMSADDVLARARVEFDQRLAQRRHVQRTAEQSEALKTLKAGSNTSALHKRQAEFAEENSAFESARNAVQMGGFFVAKETDPRWRSIPTDLIRASEIPTPIPLGHFLRQFGQSDRREVDAFNREPNSTHSLTLMNGPVTASVLKEGSLLRTHVQREPDANRKVDSIFRAVFIREPRAEERDACLDLWRESAQPEKDLIWALLNSPEFLFIQ